MKKENPWKKRFHLIFKNRRTRYGFTVLAAMIVFAVTYLLILPAITLEETVAEDMPGIVLDGGGSQSGDTDENEIKIQGDPRTQTMEGQSPSGGRIPSGTESE